MGSAKKNATETLCIDYPSAYSITKPNDDERSSNEMDSDSELEALPEMSGTTRNEVEEIHNVQRKDTNRIRVWRLVLTLALLSTGILVTVTTYRSLVEEETSKFRDAVSVVDEVVVAEFYSPFRALFDFLTN